MEWTLAIPVIAGGIRNLAGWFENSLSDGKIQAYEWGELGKTVIEIVVLAVGAMWGLGMDATSASGLAVLGSYVLSAVKKAGTK